METRLFFRANPAFLFATLTKVMQSVEVEYSGATLAGRADITNSARTTSDPICNSQSIQGDISDQYIQQEVITRVSKMVVRSISSVLHYQRKGDYVSVHCCSELLQPRPKPGTGSQPCHVLPTQSSNIYLCMFLEDISK